jgi:predicted transcriptional regulator
MAEIDDYILDVLMRDLAENVGISKSSAQGAIAWLIARQLLSSHKDNVTATPLYTVHRIWQRSPKPKK